MTTEAQESGLMVLAGAKDLQAAKEAQIALNNFVASMMKDKTDFGIIPGTNRKSLWQPGAQKLLYFNGLGVKMSCTEKVQDWKVGFFHYEYKAVAFHKQTGKEVAECFGSANSKEDRYAWRWVSENRIPRGIDKEDLKTKDGKYGQMYRIENSDKFTLPNTLVKMAQKRAMIGVSTLACRASENFTQDYEEEPAGQEEGAQQGAAKAKDVTPPKSDKPDGCISEPQLKRLRAIKAKCNVTDDELKSWLLKNYDLADSNGKVHLSWIKKGEDYTKIVEHVEWMGETPPEE